MRSILKDLFPYLTLITLMYASVSITSYYYVFHISIEHYISPSEIIPSFLNAFLFTVILVSVFTGVTNYVGTMCFYILEDRLSLEKYSSRLHDEPIISLIFPYKDRRKLAFVVSSWVAVINASIFLIGKSLLPEHNLVFIIGLMTLIALITWVLFSSIKTIRTRKWLFLIAFLLFINIPIKGYYEMKAHDIIESSGGDVIYFKHNSTQYSTGKALGYIGETIDYLFIYDRKMKCSLVFRKSEIDSLVLK